MTTPPPLSPSPQRPPTLPYHTPGGAPGRVCRVGSLVVAPKDSRLPDRCVRCGAPVDRPPIHRQLTWFSPLAYLGLLAGLLPFAILALLLQKKGHLDIGLCEAHFRRRRISIFTAWGIGGAGIALVVLAFATEFFVLAAVGFLLIFGALIFAAIATPLVKVDHIDDRYIYLKGLPRSYVEQLPLGP